MSFGEVSIEVDGQPVVINVDAEMEIGDLSTDMNRVAAQMAYWGAVWAAAEGELKSADAWYRAWRAKNGAAMIEADGKMSEWKVRQALEADPKFMTIKKSLAAATRNATLTRAIYEAFRTKANMLQSKGAMARAELEATGMSTRPKATPPVKSANMERAESAMRAANAKKRKATA